MKPVSGINHAKSMSKAAAAACNQARPERQSRRGPDGAVWLLEDERNGGGGRLLKLMPAG